MTNRETGNWSTHDNRLTDIIRTVGRVYKLIYDQYQLKPGIAPQC